MNGPYAMNLNCDKLACDESTDPGSLRASEVGSIEDMPQVLEGMWPENMKKPFIFVFRITGPEMA
jgi:hypothetical protein